MCKVSCWHKCRLRISEFWPKFTSLFEQQTQFVLIFCSTLSKSVVSSVFKILPHCSKLNYWNDIMVINWGINAKNRVVRLQQVSKFRLSPAITEPLLDKLPIDFSTEMFSEKKWVTKRISGLMDIPVWVWPIKYRVKAKFGNINY